MKHAQIRGAWRLLVLALLLLLLTTMTVAPLQPANAQESPLPTPVTDSAATSPLATPLSNDADTAAPLAGTALTSPGAVAVFVLVALVVVGGVVRYRQRS